MSHQAESDDSTLLVVCSTCGTRMHVSASHAGRRVRCPDCDTITRAPNAPPEKVKKREQVDLGEYTVRADQGPAAPPSPSKAHAETFGFNCKTCDTRLYATPDQEGSDIRCPDCHKYMRVPPAPKVEKKKAPRPVAAYGVGAEPERAALELYKPPPPPKKKKPAFPPPEVGWMTSGAATFPWRGHATRHWLMMTLLLFLAGEVTAGFFFLMSVMGQMGLFAPLGFFVGVGWLWVWALSYCAASFETVVHETANGGDVNSEDWVPSDWRESIFTFLRILFIAFVVTVMSYGISIPIIPFLNTQGIIGLAFLFSLAVFPILLMASYETDSLFLPYSPVVARSLMYIWPSWLLLWIFAVVMFGGLGMLSIAVVNISMFLEPVICSPLEAAAILIYGRLLGRVGWRVGRVSGERRWKKAIAAGEDPGAEPEPAPARSSEPEVKRPPPERPVSEQKQKKPPEPPRPEPPRSAPSRQARPEPKKTEAKPRAPEPEKWDPFAD